MEVGDGGVGGLFGGWRWRLEGLEGSTTSKPKSTQTFSASYPLESSLRAYWLPQSLEEPRKKAATVMSLTSLGGLPPAIFRSYSLIPLYGTAVREEGTLGNSFQNAYGSSTACN